MNRERRQAQMYLDIAGTVFLVLDREAKVTLINIEGCKILGLSKEEVLAETG